jgi:hypothetical protein
MTLNLGEATMTLTLPMLGYCASIIVGLFFLVYGLSRQPANKDRALASLGPGYAEGADDDLLAPLRFPDEGLIPDATPPGIGTEQPRKLIRPEISSHGARFGKPTWLRRLFGPLPRLFGGGRAADSWRAVDEPVAFGTALNPKTPKAGPEPTETN